MKNSEHINIIKAEYITLSPEGFKEGKFSSYLEVKWEWHIESGKEQILKMYPKIVSITGYIDEQAFFWNDTIKDWTLRVNDVINYESIRTSSLYNNKQTHTKSKGC